MILRRALLSVSMTMACVGLPPPPPVRGGSTTDGAPDATTGTGIGTGDVTVGMDGTGDTGDTGDTGPVIDSVCGDGIVESPEECDLGELNGSGDYCTSECTTNVCGDGYVGPGEACDDGNASSEDLCTTECGLAGCGDGVVQPGEECDEGEQNAQNGACLPGCIEAICGDQFIQEGVESCDSNNIGAQTCEDLGFDGGVLLCTPDCLEYDASNCYACGDGQIDPGEQCDGAQLGGATCATVLGAEYGGALACSPGCTIDTGGCCVNPDEPCMGVGECCSGDCHPVLQACV